MSHLSASRANQCSAIIDDALIRRSCYSSSQQLLYLTKSISVEKSRVQLRGATLHTWLDLGPHHSDRRHLISATLDISLLRPWTSHHCYFSLHRRLDYP